MPCTSTHRIARFFGVEPPLALAFTRYCHGQYCMVYDIHKGGRRGSGGVVYCALVVQKYCNSVSNPDGGGDERMID